MAGAAAVLATLWRVDELATWFLMRKFYYELQQGQSYAGALKTAQWYLRTLTRAEVEAQIAREFGHVVDLAKTPRPGATDSNYPFADAFYWAPFYLIVGR